MNKLEYRVLGDNDKTIVIETGIGNSYYDWLEVANKLSKNYKVLLYHRVGYGSSRGKNIKRTTFNIANELNDLLNELDIEEFTLLAHSYGGLCAQHYLNLYPNRLSALLLLDSASRRLEELEKLDTPFLNKHCSIEAMISMNMEFSKKTKEEMLSLQEKSIKRNEQVLSLNDFELYKEFISSAKFNETVADEFSHWISSGEDLKKNKIIADTKVKVICRDLQVSIDNWAKNGVPQIEAEIHEKHWRLLQEDLKTISSDSELIVAHGCDHMIHLENPEILYEIIDSIYK